MSRLFVALLILLAASQSQAAVKLYGEVRLGAGGVRHSDIDFYPQFGGFSAGVFIYDNIGIEGFFNSSIASDNRAGFEVDVTESSGAALRFQSPPQLGGLQAYILLGYVTFILEQQVNGIVGARPFDEDFTGAMVALGVHQNFKTVNGLSFGLEYRNHHADTGIIVDGLSFGLRYEMR